MISLYSVFANIHQSSFFVTKKLGEIKDDFKNVEIINQVSGIIDVYDESRNIVATLSNYRKSIITTKLGRILYAVSRKGQQRIGQVVVNPHVDSYSFFIRHDSNKKRSLKHLNIDVVSRPHPSLISLGKKYKNGHWTSFRSLSSRVLDLYISTDKEIAMYSSLSPGNHLLGGFLLGQEIKAIVGKNTSQIVSEIKIHSGAARYYFDDPEKPINSPELIKIAEKERVFAAQYFKRTGIPWMHYFGPHGPRPPPGTYLYLLIYS